MNKVLLTLKITLIAFVLSQMIFIFVGGFLLSQVGISGYSVCETGSRGYPYIARGSVTFFCVSNIDYVVIQLLTFFIFLEAQLLGMYYGRNKKRKLLLYAFLVIALIVNVVIYFLVLTDNFFTGGLWNIIRN
jgi:hypothetical protein